MAENTWGYIGRNFYQRGQEYLGTQAHATGMRFVKEGFGIGAEGIGRYFGPAFMAVTAYQGYKEEGAWGAVKGAASYVATDYLLGAAWSVAGTAVGFAAAGGAV